MEFRGCLSVFTSPWSKVAYLFVRSNIFNWNFTEGLPAVTYGFLRATFAVLLISNFGILMCLHIFAELTEIFRFFQITFCPGGLTQKKCNNFCLPLTWSRLLYYTLQKMEISRTFMGIKHKHVEQALIKLPKTSGFSTSFNSPY